MTGPFPAVVQVPLGLTQHRLLWGLPPLAWVALLGLTAGPVVLMGAWWVVPLTCGLGLFIVYEAANDPEFLSVWAGELRFKTRYR